MSIEQLLMHALCITGLIGLIFTGIEQVLKSKKPEHRANGTQATRSPNHQ